MMRRGQVMNKKRARFWGLTGLAIAFTLASMVSIAQAGVITNLTVDVGATTFSIWSGAGVNHIGAGVDVTNKTAVFTQNSTIVNTFNFDTTDVVCTAPCAPVVHV